MKKLILVILFVVGLFLSLNSASNANQPNWECWYNPERGGCDTGGTIGCLMKPPCY
ncbi:hypothetical protein ABRY23_12860 [Melioribacteraceae bacterium 4301-Me]|uniref:hypothetical protein n=1 Tax=Pyranulibacter aquaticus TaxID=3163344 RepID=UPI003599892A